MRNRINREKFTFYLGTVLTVIGMVVMILATATMFTGCASKKHTEKTSFHQESSASALKQLDTVDETFYENLTMTNSEKKLQLMGCAVEAAPVGAELARLDIPMHSLSNLPDGAGYTAKDGRARVELRKEGDNITVIGQCDSISRLYRFYRTMSLCELTRNDSLSRELSKTKRICAEMSEELEDLRALSENVKKPPSYGILTFCSGLLPGLVIGYQSKRILNIFKQKK